MTINGWVQIALYCLLILAVVKPLGLHLFSAQTRISGIDGDGLI